ncbi:hypothetical protein B0H14DRAFT_3451560 [Mycena olivaceomarginata]|nr:hypothetical protein B0H14DRAFT_3451560 [Mycena olivaceomarginata]
MAALIAKDATAFISWITQSQDRYAGKIIILTYLVANLAHWTTHFIAFMRIFILCPALQLAVLQKKSAIIAAEFCALIEDTSFWSGLETKDSTRLDQVLLTIAGIFLRFADHPEPNVKDKILARLERRWKDCDQPAFLLALILSPFEKLSCFGPNANLNHMKCRNLLILFYRRVKSRPDNEDTPEKQKEEEDQVSKVFMQYLAGTGDFADFDLEDPVWTDANGNKTEDPTDVWVAFAASSHLAELCEFAITLLRIKPVVNALSRAPKSSKATTAIDWDSRKLIRGPRSVVVTNSFVPLESQAEAWEDAHDEYDSFMSAAPGLSASRKSRAMRKVCMAWNFGTMILALENKVKQYSSTLGTDPEFKDDNIPECVDQFLQGVSAFRELRRNGRVTANLTSIAVKPTSSASSKKDAPTKKVRVPMHSANGRPTTNFLCTGGHWGSLPGRGNSSCTPAMVVKVLKVLTSGPAYLMAGQSTDA